MASEGSSANFERSRISSSGPIAAFVLAGKTGSGKSSFIKLLGGKDIDSGLEPVVDGGLDSCTLKPTVYITKLASREILLLDTPGFDDSAIDNLAILNEIVSNLYMFALQRREVDTQGVIFLHDIAETRFGGSQRKTLEILKALVGDKAMRNVIIGTTMWSPEGTGKHNNEVRREKEFTSKHWKGIFKTVRILDGDQNIAVQIINDLLARTPCLLLVQEEMLQPPHTCENTTAGKIAIPEGRAEAEQLRRQFEEDMKRMQEESAEREEEFRRRHEETMRHFGEERARAEREAKQREEQWIAREEENRRLHDEQMQNLSEQHRQDFQALENQRQEDARLEKEATARMWNDLRMQQAKDMKDQQASYDAKFEAERKRRDKQAAELREQERIRNEKLMEELRKAREQPRPRSRGGFCVIQ